MKDVRAATSNEEFIYYVQSNFQADPMHDALALLWSLRKIFGFPIDFIANFPWYGRGGEQRKHERVERGVGQKITD